MSESDRDVVPFPVVAIVCAVLTVFLLLPGCAADGTPIRDTGQQVLPPQGWIDYCRRHPMDVDCDNSRRTAH